MPHGNPVVSQRAATSDLSAQLVVGGPRQQDKGRPGKWFGTANDRARYVERLRAAGETIAIPA